MKSVLTMLLVAIAGSAAAAQGHPAGTEAAPQAGCVAVMPATVSGMDGNAADASLTVRDALVSFLSGPALNPIALDARVRLQAIEEARQKACTHIVTMSVTKKSGGRSGLGRVIGQAAGTAAWHIPGGTTVGSAVARSAGIGVVTAVADMAANTRAKDEMRLEWTLAPVGGGAPSRSKTEKAKASADGEDLLTPLVQRSAESIVEAMLKK